MPTQGRYLLVSFVAGALAAGLLVSLPFFTIRDRVEELQDQHEALQNDLRVRGGEELVHAGQALREGPIDHAQGWAPGARAHLRTAQELVDLWDPRGSLAPTVQRAETAVGFTEAAGACGLVPDAAMELHRSDLSRALVDLGSTLRNGSLGEDAGAPVLDAARALHRLSLDAVAGHARIQDARLDDPRGDASVTVTVERLPADGCRRRLAVDVCRLGADREPVCQATRGTSGAFRVVDEHTVRVPAPAATEETTGFRVNVTDRQLGIESTSVCEMAARDGAGCSAP